MDNIQRKKRTRFKIKNISSRKRLTVFRSNNHLYGQIINDEQGKTLTCVSSLEKTLSSENVEEDNSTSDNSTSDDSAENSILKKIKKN